MLGPAVTSEAAERPPNVVLIFADDMGYGDVGYQGAPDIPTPNIDRLAASGVRFTDGYVSCAICSPSRAGLLTGRYQNRFGFETNPGPVPPQRETAGMATTEITLAQMLQSAGYATGMVGKWHIGMQEKHRPLNRGFDEFFGFLHGAHSYLDSSRGDPVLRGRKAVHFTDYLTEVFTWSG
jgi:arylsulfatase A-like enzyme